MAWIEKKEGWIEKKGGNGKAPPVKLEKSYSVSDAARIMGVSRQTVFKWLSVDDPENAVIPPAAWWRTAGGYIMIKESILMKLQNNH